MSKASEVRVPDLGEFNNVEIIEVLVKPGDRVEKEQPLLVLESEKASMEVPSSATGVVALLKVAVGQKVSTGDLILVFDEDASELEEDGRSPLESAASQQDGENIPPPSAPILAEQSPNDTKQKPSRAKSAEIAAIRVDPPADPDATPARKTEAKGPQEESSQAAKQKPAPTPDMETQVLVLGAGPGGYSAAFRAADLGKQVTLVERYSTLGGVCLNVGCIPSKALLHSAKVIDDAAEMAKHGIKFAKPEIDLGPLRDFKQNIVGRLTNGLTALAKKRKVTVMQGTGRFTSPHTMEVTGAEGSKIIGFEHCIIAAGSQSIKLPNMPVDSRLWDSTSALALKQIPERLLVIGGGIIGLEMANVFAALGSTVDIVEMTTNLLPGTDLDLVRPLAKRMKQRCRNIWLGTKINSVHSQADALYASLDGPGVPAMQRYDAVLVAAGRRPNGQSIGAEAAGVSVDEKGFIPTDTQMRTNIPHIFAIGDIARQPMLAHKAVHEGKVAAEVIAGQKSAFDARCIPSVVYTDPEVAWTGLSEAEAKSKGIEVKIGRFPWGANGRSLGMAYTDGITRILFDKASGRVLGAGAVGPSAGELMAELCLAIEMGADAHDIGLTIHAHPTLSETVAMAAEQIAGTLTDL